MNVLYSEIATQGIYQQYIQKFWILNNIQNQLLVSAGSALPNGCCTIAFISGAGIYVESAGKITDLSAGVYLSGQITKRTSITIKPFSKAVMAQVWPWAFPIFAGVSMDQLADAVVNLEYINKGLYGQLADVDFTNEQKVTADLYHVLNAHLEMSDDSRFTHWVYQRLRMNRSTQTNIADIATASGYSQRRVEQKFKALIGITAKEMQRILQLRQLVDDLSKPGYNDNLGALAYRYGYYDQSHFIRAYQRVFLDSPSAFDASDYILPLNGDFDFLQLSPSLFR